MARTLPEGPLLAARLPWGGFIDVDTPHQSEAARRAGVRLVEVAIVGSFTEADCARIGIERRT